MSKRRARTLTEAIDLLQELDFVPGVSMAVPDANYTVGFRRNFDPVKKSGEWPYDTAEAEDSEAPEKTGQSGIGRGGIGWGGRDDVGGGVREPSSAYLKTWQQDEGADWEEEQRHGDDKYRNVWRDTPEGEEWTEMNNEAMGSPSVNSPGNTLSAMDGPQHDVLNFSGSVDDMLPKNNPNGPGNMWGGPDMIPGQVRSWGNSPKMGGNPEDPWRVPEERDMKLREFFNPEPVTAEEIDNPAQDHLEDQGDDELELDASAATEPEDIEIIPHLGQPTDFVMSPTGFGNARGSFGMHTDAVDHDLVDKGSAWDVLQKVVCALDNNLHDDEG